MTGNTETSGGTVTYSVNTNFNTSGKDYAVKVDSGTGGLYVNVP